MLGTLMDISTTTTELPASQSQSNDNLKNSAAATINWILKDGLGQAGGIALVSLLGSRLDCQARSLRFHSTLLFLVGSFLEFSIPFACTPLSAFPSSTVFLMMASSANVLKNVSWMLVSATRAHFMKYFALKGNLGDLTGKAASQMTCSSLIGTGLGLLVLKCFPNTITCSFAIFSLIGLYSTFKSCKVALSRQLNTDRVFQLIETLSKQRLDDTSTDQIYRYIWTPEILAERENFIWNDGWQWKPKIIFNATLNNDLPNMEWIVSMEELETRKYAIAKSKNCFYVWFLDTAGNEDKLSSIIRIALEKYNMNIDIQDGVIEGLRRQGWDIEHFNCKINNEDGALKLIVNKEE